MRARLRHLLESGRLDLPLPGLGQTGLRHALLTGIAREDLSLARLAEAHVDAVAILSEAGRKPQSGALYGVWASEAPNHKLILTDEGNLQGTKNFCTGAGIVDRALISIREPERRLVDLDLQSKVEQIHFDTTGWVTSAFAETQTALVTFSDVPVTPDQFLGEPNWYLDRPGFWHGACGPAACWAGGALGLYDYACAHTKNNPHALAHLGAMHAAAWSMKAALEVAGHEIDAAPNDREAALIRALTVRHLIEQSCTEILNRFGRAHGPRPLAFDEAASKRYQEVQLYIRQSHAEDDLQSLGEALGSRGHAPSHRGVGSAA